MYNWRQSAREAVNLSSESLPLPASLSLSFSLPTSLFSTVPCSYSLLRVSLSLARSLSLSPSLPPSLPICRSLNPFLSLYRSMLMKATHCIDIACTLHTRCSTLQRTATDYSDVYGMCMGCECDMSNTHCNTPQRNAVHCTATHHNRLQ